MRFDEKNGGGSHEVDRDIDKVNRYAEGTGIGVVEGGNQKESEQGAFELDAPEGAIVFAKVSAFHECEEKKGNEEQLHMLEGRFVYSREGGNDDAFSRPFINKVKDRSEK